jgi:hypothetical protein
MCIRLMLLGFRRAGNYELCIKILASSLVRHLTGDKKTFSITVRNMRERTGFMVVQWRAFVGRVTKLCTLWSTLSSLNRWIIINFLKKKGSLQPEWFLFNRNGVWQIIRYSKGSIQTEIAKLSELLERRHPGRHITAQWWRKGDYSVVAVCSVDLLRKSRSAPLKWCSQNSGKSASWPAIVTALCAEATGQTSWANSGPSYPKIQFSLSSAFLYLLFKLLMKYEYSAVHPHKNVNNYISYKPLLFPS